MSMATVLAQRQVEFTTSPFVPLALGFFGLGVGYLIYGPEELFMLPKRSRGRRYHDRPLGNLDARVPAIRDRCPSLCRADVVPHLPRATPAHGGGRVHG